MKNFFFRGKFLPPPMEKKKNGRGGIKKTKKNETPKAHGNRKIPR